MRLHTHEDEQIRGYSGILTSLFPEQTKTIPRIIVWSIILLLDLVLGIGSAVHFGLLQFERFNSMNQMVFAAILLVVAILVVFWLQGRIWYALVKLFKKKT